MNLFNFKKTIAGMWILAVTLVAQYAFAADPYLMCASATHVTWKERDFWGYDWDWSETGLTPAFSSTAYKDDNYLRLKGSNQTIVGVGSVDIGKGTFIINTPNENGTSPNLGQAKSVCQDLQRFCQDRTDGYKYLGAAWSDVGGSYYVGLFFKNDPSNPQENDSVLICPGWQDGADKDPLHGIIFGPLTTTSYTRSKTRAYL